MSALRPSRRLDRALPRAPLRHDAAAEVGIGTMIVFIATILVAAIAAGVLISTSQKLQEKSKQTGDEARQNVAGTLTVLSATGSRADATTNVQKVHLRVQLAAGADPVDLTSLVLHYNDGTTQTDYAWAASADATHFATTWIRGAGTNSVAVAGDIVELAIGDDSANNAANALDLGPSTRVAMTLIPEHGVQVYIAFTTPDTYLQLLSVDLF